MAGVVCLFQKNTWMGQNSNIRLMRHSVRSLSLSVTGLQERSSAKHLCYIKIKTENISPSTLFPRHLKYFPRVLNVSNWIVLSFSLSSSKKYLENGLITIILTSHLAVIFAILTNHTILS